MTLSLGIATPSIRGHLQGAVAPSWVIRGASLDVDFINRRAFRSNQRTILERFDDDSLGDLLTFTRASVGTRFQADGDLNERAVDAMRFDHDPSTFAALGILIEGSRTNLCTYSNDIANAAWTKSGASVTDNAGTSKDGTTNADFVVESATTAEHYVTSAAPTLSDATAYTVTAIAKSSNRTLQIELAGPRFGSDSWANFDLVNGVVGTVGAGVTSTRIEALGGGWYRCHITATTTSSGSGATRFSIAQSASSAKRESYAGDGTSGVFLTFVQVEAGTFASSYIATTTAAATRAADVLTADVGDWFNPSEGTLTAEYSVPAFASGALVVAVQFDDGTTANRVAVIAQASGGVAQGFVRSAAINQASLSLGAAVQGQIDRIALALASNDFASSRNGGVTVTDDSGDVPSGLTTIRFGIRSSDVEHLFGHLRRVTYIPRRVSNAELQALAA